MLNVRWWERQLRPLSEILLPAVNDETVEAIEERCIPLLLSQREGQLSKLEPKLIKNTVQFH